MKNITLVTSAEACNCITHAGNFHADDLMATILLGKILPEVKLLRTNKVPDEALATEDILVFDIGGGAYDHHQKGGNGQRENGVKYAAFGLLWRDFGRLMLSKMTENVEDVFELFDRNFVQAIDAMDNGQCKKQDDIPAMSLSGALSTFNPNWDDEGMSGDERFMQALVVAEAIFDNALSSAISKARAKAGVEQAIENAENGIMVLPVFMPWQEFLFTSHNGKSEEILYVVHPSNRGGYYVQCVPDAPGSFGQRKSLPESWAGLRGTALAEVTNVATANFCHPGKFLCGADTIDDAMALAYKAINA